MNIKFIVILIIFLIIILIWYILLKISANNIEKFEILDNIAKLISDNLILYPPISNYTATNLTSDLDNIKSNFKITLNINEKIELDNTTGSTNNQISLNNGYGTYYILSSFITDNTYLISNLFKLNNNYPVILNNTKINSIKLVNNTTISGNYIIFKYSEYIKFNKIILSANIDISEYISIYYTTYNDFDTFIKLPAKITNNNNIITINNLENVTLLNTLLILFNNSSISSYSFNYINIYGVPKHINTDGIQTDLNNQMKILDNNINNTFELIENNYNNDKEYEKIDNLTQFNMLITYNIPWGIYNGAITQNNKLVDLLGRKCKDAIINNEYNIISNESTYYDGKNVNIPYLKGTTSTQIIFPEGSLPKLYTICVISRYTNPNRNKQRILTATTAQNPNWLLGHWNGYKNVAYNITFINNIYNGSGFITPLDTPGDINWVVSCCKSSAKDISKGLLFNNIPSGLKILGDIHNNDKAALCINAGEYTGEKSDFGLSYLIIWDKVLSDYELSIASNTLINYLITKTDPQFNISINIKDGSSSANAGDSALGIKMATCTNKDGIYWINIPVKNNKSEIISYTPTPIYCIMNSICHGGGWMLAIKGASNSGVFTYNSKYWTTPETLNTSNTDMNNTDAKFDIFNTYVFKQSMAIFSKDDTNNQAIRFPNNPEYGWTWLLSTKIKNLSLLDFFAGNNREYFYTSVNDNITSINNSLIRHIKLSPNDFDNYIINQTYHPKIWSQQSHFKAYGFNVSPGNFNGATNGGWNHSARWGGTFNENTPGLPDSNDVSGGIGVSNRAWNAGDCIGCCQSSTGLNKQMGFKWFIR